MGWQQQLGVGVGVGPLQPHFLSPNPTAHKPINTPASLPLSSTKTRNYTPRLRAISLQQLPPKCPSPEKRPQLERWVQSRGRFGNVPCWSRTQQRLLNSSPNCNVLELQGQKLGLELLQIAQQEEADEFIIGLPKSSDGKETPQSNKVRSVAGRFPARAAERDVFIKDNPHIVDNKSKTLNGKKNPKDNVPPKDSLGWRVYLQDEHGTKTEATDRMICMGLSRSTWQSKIDAYAAMMILERYFSLAGLETELVLPKDLDLQEKLKTGPPRDIDFFPEEFEG